VPPATPVRSARLAGAAEATWGDLGIPLAPHDCARFERYQEKPHAVLGVEAFEQARRGAARWRSTQAITFALTDPG
jgi:hypothetical protein